MAWHGMTWYNINTTIFDINNNPDILRHIGHTRTH